MRAAFADTFFYPESLTADRHFEQAGFTALLK
jgi:hypothetical protein